MMWPGQTRPPWFSRLAISQRTHEFARELTRLILGLDQLYRGDQSQEDDGDSLVSREGLVAVNLSGEQPGRFSSWADGRAGLDGLAAEIPYLREPDRRLYYQDLVDSLKAIVEWRTGGLPFPDQVAELLRVPGRPIPEETLAGYRDRLGRILQDLGFSGDLPSRVRAWEERSAVADDRLEETYEELQREGRRRTVALFGLPMSGDLALVREHGVSYNAYCDYEARKMRINADQSYTKADLKHLVGHEAFPGHFTHLLLRQTLADEGFATEDVKLVVTDTASSATFEGLGERGLAFLDWIDGPDDLICSSLRRLRTAAACNASWQLHALGRPPEAVAEYLRTTAMGDEGWVRSRMRFIGYALRAPFIFAYWYGDLAVERAWSLIPEPHRHDFFVYLYSRLHSPRSMELFSPWEA